MEVIVREKCEDLILQIEQLVNQIEVNLGDTEKQVELFNINF